MATLLSVPERAALRLQYLRKNILQVGLVQRDAFARAVVISTAAAPMLRRQAQLHAAVVQVRGASAAAEVLEGIRRQTAAMEAGIA